MKPFVILALALPACALGFAQSTPPPAAVTTHLTNPVRPTAASRARAKQIYGYDCAMCHGVNGNGKGDVVVDATQPMLDYTNPAALKDMTDGELYTIIKDGKGKMSGEGDRAKPDEIWNLVIYLRSFSKKQNAG